MKKRAKAGRPTEIGEKTVIATYNLTARQKAWLRREAKKRGLSASDVLREIIEGGMAS